MRYVVTGAAGFIGSHLGEALQRGGARGRRHRLLHRLLRPGAEGAERARARREAHRPRRGRRSTSTASTASSTSPASRACAASAIGLPALRAPERAREPARLRGGREAGTRVVFASSSSIYGEAERYPTPEDVPPRPVSPYGITKLDCRAPRAGLRAQLRARRDRPALLQRLRAAPAAGHGLPARRRRARRGRPFTLFGDGEQSRSFTFVARRRRRDASWRWSAPRRGRLQRRRRPGGDDERDASRRSSGSRAGRSTSATSRPSPGDQRRTKADTTRIESELGWARARSLEEGLRAQWEWTAVESPRDEPPAIRPGSRRRAGGRPPLGLGARSPRAGGCRCSGRSLGLLVGFLLAVGGGKVYEAETLDRDGPAVLAERRRARAELPHERPRGRARSSAPSRRSRRPRSASGLRVARRCAATSPRRSSARPARARGRPERRSSRSP